MKRLLPPIAAAVLVALVVLAGLAWRAWITGPPPDYARDPQFVVVAPGTTLRQVAADLHRRGLLAQPRLLLLAARLQRCDRSLQVGRYVVVAGASPRDLLRILCRGRPLPVVVSLPEGQAAPALAAILADSLQLAPAAILAAADALITRGADTLMTRQERERLAALIAQSARPGGSALHWCEGYLAPDTYHFAPQTDAAAAARTVVGLQLARLAQIRAQVTAPAAPLSPHALVTLASLVEAEARLAAERALIAAVYHNRLRRGMRLEADPTIAFWLNKRGERLLYRDLEIDSPYNTYRRDGLPPGPIGAPGLAALTAAAAPDTTCAALFFVADGEGGHIFSQTHAEHERAVARYREIMRQRR